MADTTFIDGDLSQSNRIVAAWLNDVNNLRYGNSDPARGAALLQFIAEITGSTVRTVQQKLYEIPSVLVLGATGDGATDDTAAIQAAIDGVRTAGGGTLLVPEGSYKISEPLVNCQSVRLIGAGEGRNTQPAVTAASQFLWYGGAEPMVVFGDAADTVVGGGMSGIKLNGRVLATECLYIKDFQHGLFQNLSLMGCVTNAIELTNTDGRDPTGFSTFNDIQIPLRGGGTNSANGVYLNGVGAGASGVTRCTWKNLRIEHANGHGLIFGFRADSHLFESFFAFRASSVETGYGIRFSSNDQTAVNTTNRFIGNTVVSGGISIRPQSTAGTMPMEGTGFNDINTTELAADLTDRFNPFTSVGKVFGTATTEHRLRTGFHRLMHENQGHSFDDFRFVAYTYPVLSTNSGTWFTVRNGAGGTIQSAVQPGGAVDLITGTGGTDDIAIYASADFTSGITYANNPLMQFTAAPASTATVRDQWGMFGDATLPDPTDGVYVQFDPAVSAFYQLISRKAGTSTTITTDITGAASKRMWLICLDDTGNALFFSRLATAVQWTYLGLNATNMPIVALTAGFRVRAQAAANRDCHIYSCEFGHSLE